MRWFNRDKRGEATRPPLPRSYEQEGLSYAARAIFRQMRLTRHQWYEANRRLKARLHFSVFAQAWLALSIIIASVLALAFPPEHPNGKALLEVSTIGTGVFVLALGLIETWHDYRKKADQMFDGANAIGQLHDKLRHKLDCDRADMQAVLDATLAYHEILRTTPENHEQIDFKNALLRNPEFGPWRLHKFLEARSISFLTIYLPYVVMMGVPIALIWVAYRL